MAKLTAIEVKNAKAGRHCDGKDLYLLVKPSGAKSWVLRIQVDGKRRDYGLGPVDIVSLQEAREKALEGRKLAKAGLDPSLEWKKAREVMPTFEQAARRYYETVKNGWRNGKHVAQWLSTLETYAFPQIGRRPVDQIDAAAIQSVLLSIWLEKPETARRVKQRIGAVLDFAHGQGWRPTEAPMRAISKGLPRQGGKVRHLAAMPYAEVPAFMNEIALLSPTAGRLALQFAVLTAARSGEVRGASWKEIDWDRAQWNIPADRMKAGEAHSIPLSKAALRILKQAQDLPQDERTDLVFPGLRGQPLSDMTLTKALKAAVGAGQTVHGFRSTFRDWVAEQTKFPGDWAEAALAHTLPNKVEAAYRRTKFLDQRRKLMDAWASYVSGSGNVVRLATSR